MPVFECQECEYLTNDPFVAKIHNEKDPNHFFKQVGIHTWRDIKVQRIFDQFHQQQIQKLKKMN